MQHVFMWKEGDKEPEEVTDVKKECFATHNDGRTERIDEWHEWFDGQLHYFSFGNEMPEQQRQYVNHMTRRIHRAGGLRK